MDTFGGQDNARIGDLCEENTTSTTIVPHNLTNKFQPLDLSVNKSAKSSITSKFNTWYAEQVTEQLTRGIAAPDIKVSLKLNDMKPLHAKWICELYEEMQTKKDIIIQGFKSAGILEAVNEAEKILRLSENPFQGD